MNIPFLSFDYRNEFIREETLKTFQEFFDSKWYVLGSGTTKFEEDYALFNKTKYCTGVSNGLDALHLSLKALDIKQGDEVIVPSNTYIATVLAISYVGATPIFVEPKYDTCNLDPNLIEAKITNRTKAIMPVHLFGQACEMKEIMEIAKKHDLYIVEDNAQAQGATNHGKITGSFGDINAVSFYPSKNLGALGEAGAVTTDNEKLNNKVRVLRNYGSQKRYYNQYLGYNNRIDEFEARFLSLILKYLPEWNDQRKQIASWYTEMLNQNNHIKINKVADHCTTVNHLYVIKTDQRDQLQTELNRAGIGTIIHYPIPPHLQECYKGLKYQKGDFPIAERLAKECLSLPLYPGLNRDQVSYICNTINNFFD